jgi:hypothetical protein
MAEAYPLPHKAMGNDHFVEFLVAILEADTKLEGAVLTAKAVLENSVLGTLTPNEFKQQYPGYGRVMMMPVNQLAPLLAQMGYVVLNEDKSFAVTDEARDWYRLYLSGQPGARQQLAEALSRLWFARLDVSSYEAFSAQVFQARGAENTQEEQIAAAYSILEDFGLLLSMAETEARIPTVEIHNEPSSMLIDEIARDEFAFSDDSGFHFDGSDIEAMPEDNDQFFALDAEFETGEIENDALSPDAGLSHEHREAETHDEPTLMDETARDEFAFSDDSGFHFDSPDIEAMSEDSDQSFALDAESETGEIENDAPGSDAEPDSQPETDDFKQSEEMPAAESRPTTQGFGARRSSRFGKPAEQEESRAAQLDLEKPALSGFHRKPANPAEAGNEGEQKSGIPGFVRGSRPRVKPLETPPESGRGSDPFNRLTRAREQQKDIPGSQEPRTPPRRLIPAENKPASPLDSLKRSGESSPRPPQTGFRRQPTDNRKYGPRSAPPQQSTPNVSPVIVLTLPDGTRVEITQQFLDQWKAEHQLTTQEALAAIRDVFIANQGTDDESDS